MTYDYLTSCLACGSKELEQYLDLGRQTFANTYPTEYRADSVLPSAPLQVNVCLKCWHSQLSVVANPEELFSDYLYVSGTTTSLAEHFSSLVNWTLTSVPDLARRIDTLSVLDIGANDYSLLRAFQKRGIRRLEGVDPSANLAHLAGNIPALVDFWGTKTWHKVQNAPYDIITGLNVFAHNLNPLDFLRACRRVLAPEGRIILEMPGMLQTLQGRKFTQIYHEHINYFSVTSMLVLVERAGFNIVDLIEFPDIHEGTLRFVLKSGSLAHNPKVQEFIHREYIMGLCDISYYSDFSSQVKTNCKELESTLKQFKEKNRPIIAYGASAKFSTLSAANIYKYIDYVVDDNPLKCGRFHTNTGLRIIASENLKKEVNPVILITPDNFFNEIRSKINKMGVSGDFVRYVPIVEIVRS